MYRGFRSSFLSFLRFVRSFILSSLRSFVQTVWFRGLRPDTIRPYELSDSVVLGRIAFRSLRLLRTKRFSFSSNILAMRCVSDGSGRQSGTNCERTLLFIDAIHIDDDEALRFITAWAIPIIAKGC